MCERCGYSLVGTPIDGACPECGEPAVLSIGPGVRRGALWERRHALGYWATWWRCSLNSVLRPAWFGKQLRVPPQREATLRFAVTYLPILAVVGFGGVLAAASIGQGAIRFSRQDLEEIGIFARFYPLVVFVFAFVCAALVSAYSTTAAGRDNSTNLFQRIYRTCHSTRSPLTGARLRIGPTRCCQCSIV